VGLIADVLVGVVCRFRAKSGLSFGPRSPQNCCAIGQRALQDVAAGLENDELLAGNQGEHRVGRGLGVFDEVAIYNERAAVEACQFDHV